MTMPEALRLQNLTCPKADLERQGSGEQIADATANAIGAKQASVGEGDRAPWGFRNAR